MNSVKAENSQLETPFDYGFKERVVSNKVRLESLDLARGIAIVLMIISHGVVGLFPFDAFDQQALNLHLYTKFSSTLFFLVFGIALGLYYVPYADDETFPAKRRRLLFRGLEILIWYKILTVVQMFQTYDHKTILNTLLYLDFPDFAEVLGFYAIFLLWFPFVIKPWKKLAVSTQLIIVGILAAAGTYLTNNFDFWGYTSIKAILVEQRGYFTFGQFQRGAIVLFGVILGSYYFNNRTRSSSFPLKLTMMGIALLCVFVFVSQEDVLQALRRIAGNGGKHPPLTTFMSFSMGGALLLLAAALSFGSKVPIVFRPFVWIGQKPLQAFIFHIFVIFVVYRYLLDLRHKVPYETALWLTLLLVGMTMVWTYLVKLKDQK